MAVDLGDLIDSLRREVNPLGSDAFPDATDDNYAGYLEDAFWEARMDGVLRLANFDDTDGIITPKTVGGDDLTRDLQQLLVLYAGIRILRNYLTFVNTSFRAEAGPAQYETEKSANLLKGILNELQTRRNIVLERLSDVGAAPSFIIDAVAEREGSIGYGLTWWSGS